MNVESRRLIHVALSLAAIAPVLLLPRGWAVLLLGGAVACAAAVEAGRRRGRMRARFLALFGGMLKPRERDEISGATWLAVAFLLSAALFPPHIAATAMLYGGLGDPAASFVGRKWGRPQSGGKSWQGFLGGFLVDSAAGLAMPGVGTTAALIGALAASLTEALPLPLDDNLRTTLAGGVALWAASMAIGAAG